MLTAVTIKHRMKWLYRLGVRRQADVSEEYMPSYQYLKSGPCEGTVEFVAG
jgi:hypothetical protein